MDDVESSIHFQGGTNRNFVFTILQLNEILDEDIQTIHNSPYYDLDKLLAERHNERFNILGANMYLSETFNCKVILFLNQHDTWESQYIKVASGGLSKYIIIGNIYRP